MASLSLKMYKIHVTFGVKAHNADNPFIMYMYILLSRFNLGREPKMQKGENTKYDRK